LILLSHIDRSAYIENLGVELLSVKRALRGTRKSLKP